MIQGYALTYLPVSYKKAETTPALFTTESLPACPHRHSIRVYERKVCREGRREGDRTQRERKMLSSCPHCNFAIVANEASLAFAEILITLLEWVQVVLRGFCLQLSHLLK